MLLHRFCFFILYLRAISKYRLSGAYIRGGNLTEDFFFCVTSLGDLNLEGLISEFSDILRAFVVRYPGLNQS